jgi:hypothetical protein
MTRRATVAERLASADKDILLADIASRSEWDQLVVEQVVLTIGQIASDFDCNMIRDALPEMGRGFLGAAINSLRMAQVIEHTGRMVPSTSAATHGHRIAVWTLTDKGWAIAAQRRAVAQGRAA